jgi:glycosyltransferase involved in cell wall biosynthesis
MAKDETAIPSIKKTPPALSIIVPVYNRETKLMRCIDSLVFQSMDNYEIILIDDHSTDGSYRIEEYYQKQFPEKVFLYNNIGKGVASARNYGITVARGKYIAFVDSDDYVELWAYNKVSLFAEGNNCDVVCSPYIKTTANNQEVKNQYWLKPCKIVDDESKNEFLISECPNLWNKLFRKDILPSPDPFPDVPIGEDTAFVYPLLSRAKVIGIFNNPYYYYEYSDNSISTNPMDPRHSRHMYTVNDCLLNNGNPAYRAELALLAIKRLCYHHRTNTFYRDIIERYIKEVGAELLLAANKYSSITENKYFKEIYDTPNHTYIPECLILNGFNRSISEDEQANAKKALFSETEVPALVILNETNCDINENVIIKEAYDAGLYNLVGGYFALKYLYKQGGIYIGTQTKVNARFGYVLGYNAFFGYMNSGDISDRVFGGKPAQRIFEMILQTFTSQDWFRDRFTPLEKRIKKMLIGHEGLCLKSESFISNNDVYVGHARLFSYCEDVQTNICEHIYNKMDLEEVTTIPKALYKDLIRQAKENTRLSTENMWLKKTGIREAGEALHAILGSKSYLIGRLVTFPFRKLRGVIRVIKISGFHDTNNCIQRNISTMKE